MELTELAPIHEWEALVIDIQKQFEICSAVYNIQSGHITHVADFCNRICPVIKQNQEAVGAICAVAATSFTAQAQATRQTVISECDAGMLKIAAPIIVNGEFVGTAGGCGLLAEDGELEDFLIQKVTGLSDEELEDLCRDTRVITETRAQECAEFIERRIAEITKRFI